MGTDDSAFEREPSGDAVFRADGFPSETILTSSNAWRVAEPANKPALKAVPGNAAPIIKPRFFGSPVEQTIVGSSPAAKELRELIEAYAEEDAPVLIAGETGVGKELVARQLHRFGKRAEKPFVALNAGAIPETLAAAELFGHVKGAFTGAIAERRGALSDADGGILFLDEIGDMPLSVQTHLLRVLDDGVVTKIGARTPVKVDFRLLAATNVDLAEAVDAGRFRQDLFYRINVLIIDVPPLRARGDDVIEIAESIIRSHPTLAYRKADITPAAADKLRSYRFPGNIRELANVLARALVRAKGGKILPDDLGICDFEPSLNEFEGLDIAAARDLVSKFILLKALRHSNGNVKRAAELTGRSRGTLHALKKELAGDDLASEYATACARLRSLIGDC